MWLGTQKMSRQCTVCDSTCSKLSFMKLISLQPVLVLSRQQNVNLRSYIDFTNSFSSLCFQTWLYALKYHPHHSHIMMMFGDLAIVSTMPCRAQTSIVSTSMSTKSTTVSFGRTLSTLSSTTSQQVSPVLLAPLKPGFVLIRAPPVFPLSTSLVPLIVTLLAPILQATALSSNSLRQIFFSSIGYDRSVGSKANIFPFGPTPLANTIAQIPMCAPRFSIVSPYFTSLAMALRLCGYQLPPILIQLETEPSKSSTTRLTPQIVGTKTSLSVIQNFS